MATFADIADFFGHIERAIDRALEEIATETGKLLVNRAKDKLGDTPPAHGWRELAPSTQETRARLGYPAEEALLREGALQDSIGAAVGRQGNITAVVVSAGTGLAGQRSSAQGDYARIQELGGFAGNPQVYIPPRPYLAPTLVESEDDILSGTAEKIADHVVALGARP